MVIKAKYRRKWCQWYKDFVKIWSREIKMWSRESTEVKGLAFHTANRIWITCTTYGPLKTARSDPRGRSNPWPGEGKEKGRGIERDRDREEGKGARGLEIRTFSLFKAKFRDLHQKRRHGCNFPSRPGCLPRGFCMSSWARNFDSLDSSIYPEQEAFIPTGESE